MDAQLVCQGGEAHGGKLCGLPGEEGTLSLQNGLGALTQRIAAALQTAQQPFGLLHLLPEIGPGLGVIRLLEEPGVVGADGHAGQVVVVEHHLELSLQLHDEHIRLDVDRRLRRLKGAPRVGVQSGDDLLRCLDLLDGDAQRPGDGAVVLAAQLRQKLGGDVDGHLAGALAPQLQHQALCKVPGAHARRVQRLQFRQGTVRQFLGQFQLLQTLQILRCKIPVLIHQLCQVCTQRQ